MVGDGPLSSQSGKRVDKNFRRYTSAVERALSLFDTTLQEWADYIAFLGRLLKALQTVPQGTHEIPFSPIVSKRLSQCLNPTLPSVHQKALEVYAVAFTILGKNGLSRELSLYLPGLSPLLSFASSLVRPHLLSLFETYIIPLDDATLRPALRAIILALLPGLEEDSSDDFERTHQLLDRLRNVFSKSSVGDGEVIDTHGDRYFWQSLFLVSITSANRRPGVLAFLIRNLPRLNAISHGYGSMPASENDDRGNHTTQLAPHIEAVTSPEPGLLIRCFCAGLQDDHHLTQRGFLDLLTTHLPLNAEVLHQRVSPRDVEILIGAAASVVIRREMSLNRRLWVWLLGQSASSETDQQDAPGARRLPTEAQARLPSPVVYFENFGLRPLVNFLLHAMTDASQTPTVKARPLRICLSLMDRWEIGGLVVPMIFRPAMEDVYSFKLTAPSPEAFSEVLRSANVFFDAIQSRLIWREMIALLLEALDQPRHRDVLEQNEEAEKLLQLFWFVITTFNIREEEMLTDHLPNALAILIVSLSLSTIQTATSAHLRGEHRYQLILKICTYLIDIVPDHTFISRKLGQERREPTQAVTDTDEDIIQRIRSSYGNPNEGKSHSERSFQAKEMGDILVLRLTNLILMFLDEPKVLSQLSAGLSLLTKFMSKTMTAENIDTESMLSNLVMTTNSQLVPSATNSLVFSQTLGRIAVLEFICSAMDSRIWQSHPLVREMLVKNIRSLWPFVSPLYPKHNVEAVRGLWRLHRICLNYQLAEAAITSLLHEEPDGTVGRNVTMEGARCFAIIWTHSVTSSRQIPSQRPDPKKRSSLSESRLETYMQEPEVLARPLFILLDKLREPHTEVARFVRTWLKSMPNISPLLDLIIARLNNSLCVLSPELASADNSMFQNYAHQAKVTTYYVRLIASIIDLESQNVPSALSTPIPFIDAMRPHLLLQMTSLLKESHTEGNVDQLPAKEYIAQVCAATLRNCVSERQEGNEDVLILQQDCSMLLQLLLPYVAANSAILGHIQNVLVEILSWAVDQSQVQLQYTLIENLVLSLQRRLEDPEALIASSRRSQSKERQRSTLHLQMPSKPQETTMSLSNDSHSDSPLMDCLMLGLRSRKSQATLEQWLRLLETCLAVYGSNTLQILLPLVGCITSSIESLFQEMAAHVQHSKSEQPLNSDPLQSLNLRLNALELVLSKGHDLALKEEIKSPSFKSPEQNQGFFGTMVSGVLGGEAYMTRSATANNYLTVLLCFRDAIKGSFRIWSWEDEENKSSSKDTISSATFNYMSVRLRNRTRRVLEHLFSAETLESVEMLIEIWKEKPTRGGKVLDLLHTLEASRPKHTMPAIFNALYSRTNSSVLDPARKSTLTSDLSDIQLATFLVVYTESMDDDALDEVWTDCMTFSKDVLGNPMPQRQILPLLLEFIAVLGGKINNTNFGEQRRMGKDIGDLFVRMLAAIFTTKPLSLSVDETNTIAAGSKRQGGRDSNESRHISFSNDTVNILGAVLPGMTKLLIDTDRIGAVASTISLQILIPAFHWKTFPQNITSRILGIMQTVSRIPEVSKTWRKDVAEAFNEPKFFSPSTLHLVESGWMPILRQWTLLDRERMTDLLSRLTPPTSAGIMFGVGASSARLEADRKAQVNLRRVTLLVLAADTDAFVPNMKMMEDKLTELLNATAASSPSSVTRAEIYMALRAIILRISTVHLASFWPTINSELKDALGAIGHIMSRETYNITSILQAAKLLDTLLILAPDDFQLREWLYITDSIDAVYRPADWKPVALVDELAEVLGNEASAVHSARIHFAGDRPKGLRKPLLKWEDSQSIPREKLLDRILKPFLRQLSINAFEATYEMEVPDRKACCDELLRDLFDDTTLV
ncbi:uncharacterized protein KY384_002580 [Bacidia gigantensis]|uniref:uncharacterized protein n=1 Tax=Bacidia gigantensis TaxID=2732470 RepID=UPI001D04A087|nr:uncharacterized protein KY384_002580 [Bacidia gigantensis]KAG8532703.1 hypothetical protein KY384_002580 [Bacidia gigantensis]